MKPCILFLAVGVSCFALMGFGAWWLQGKLGLLPCPLCVVQRIAFLGVGLTALAYALAGWLSYKLAAYVADVVAAVWLAAWATNLAAACQVFLGALTYGVIYTLWLKRRTWLNIVFGGFAGTFALLAGALAVDPELRLEPAMLAIAMFFWTPPHFWSLALYNRQDYVAAGVPMLPAIASDRLTSRVILAHTVLLVQLAAREREAGASVTVAAQPCRVTAAPMALRRVVGNLLSIAQLHGGAGTVELLAQRHEGAVRIGVVDRGPGIPHDQLEAVFRPFHRVDASRSPGTGGSGLGLAIVRQLSQANGWTVHLENRAGGGLAAWVTLPSDVQPS